MMVFITDAVLAPVRCTPPPVTPAWHSPTTTFTSSTEPSAAKMPPALAEASLKAKMLLAAVKVPPSTSAPAPVVAVFPITVDCEIVSSAPLST